MKKPYEGMNVRYVGVVSTVVNKSGSYSDNSSNFEAKTFDSGAGND